MMLIPNKILYKGSLVFFLIIIAGCVQLARQEPVSMGEPTRANMVPTTLVLTQNPSQIIPSPWASPNMPLTSVPTEKKATASATPSTFTTKTLVSRMLRLETLQRGQTLPYQGLVPGLSTRADVLTLMGMPMHSRRYAEFESLHYFYQRGGREYFLIKNGVLFSVTSNLTPWLMVNGKAADETELTKATGIDLIVGTDPFLYKIFPEYGLAVSGGVLQVFQPMSLKDHLNLWGQYGINYDPYPPVSQLTIESIHSGVTTLAEVLKIMSGSDGGTYGKRTILTYDLAQDGLGGVGIYFDEKEVVELISFNDIRKNPTLGSFMDKYGRPDLVKLSPDFEGNKYDRVNFVSLARGLLYSGKCKTRECKIYPELIVVQILYFVPVSDAEYRRQFPEALFIPWQGFEK